MHTSKSSISRETPELVIKSIFKRYDADGNGHLDPEEFANALDDLGIIDQYEQQALFALADADNSKTIEYDEFLQLIKGHDFEFLLANRDDYLFVIETYKTFQDYDQDGDGEVTWGEFYHYLSKHGYSHEYISQYWHYMDEDKSQTISFAEFWIGFKSQAQALRQQTLHEQMNEQLLICHQESTPIGSDGDDTVSDYDSNTPHTPLSPNNSSSLTPMSYDNQLKKGPSYRSKLLGGKKHQRIPSLHDNRSYNQSDKNNIFRVMKRHLKKTSVKKRKHKQKLGRVVDSDSDDDDDNKASFSDDEHAKTVNPTNRNKQRSNSKLDTLYHLTTDIILPSNHLKLPTSHPMVRNTRSIGPGTGGLYHDDDDWDDLSEDEEDEEEESELDDDSLDSDSNDIGHFHYVQRNDDDDTHDDTDYIEDDTEYDDEDDTDLLETEDTEDDGSGSLDAESLDALTDGYNDDEYNEQDEDDREELHILQKTGENAHKNIDKNEDGNIQENITMDITEINKTDTQKAPKRIEIKDELPNITQTNNESKGDISPVRSVFIKRKRKSKTVDIAPIKEEKVNKPKVSNKSIKKEYDHDIKTKDSIQKTDISIATKPTQNGTTATQKLQNIAKSIVTKDDKSQNISKTDDRKGSKSPVKSVYITKKRKSKSSNKNGKISQKSDKKEETNNKTVRNTKSTANKTVKTIKSDPTKQAIIKDLVFIDNDDDTKDEPLQIPTASLKVDVNNKNTNSDNTESNTTKPHSPILLSKSDSAEVKESDASAVVIAETQSKPTKPTKSVQFDSNLIDTKKKSTLKGHGKKKSIPKIRQKSNDPQKLKKKRRKKKISNKKRQSTPNFANKMNNAKANNRNRGKKKTDCDGIPKVKPRLKSATSNPTETNSNHLKDGKPSALMQKASKHKMAHSAYPQDIDKLIESGQDTTTKPRKIRKKKGGKKSVKRPKYAIKRRGSLDLNTESVTIHKSDSNLVENLYDKPRREKNVESKTERKRKKTDRKSIKKKPIKLSLKDLAKIKIPRKKKKGKKAKRDTITDTGNKVSRTIRKMKKQQSTDKYRKKKDDDDDDKKEDSVSKKKVKVKGGRKQIKKSEYAQKASVGLGFDLFQNYRMKRKTTKQNEQYSGKTQREIEREKYENALREKKKHLQSSKTPRNPKKKTKKTDPVPPNRAKLKLKSSRSRNKHIISSKSSDIDDIPQTKLSLKRSKSKTKSNTKPSKSKHNKSPSKSNINNTESNMLDIAGPSEPISNRRSSMVYIEDTVIASNDNKKKKDKGKNTKKDTKTGKKDKKKDSNDGKRSRRRKHQRNDTKHGSLDLNEITRDVGAISMNGKKQKNGKKGKRLKKKKISNVDQLRAKYEQQPAKTDKITSKPKRAPTKRKKSDVPQSATAKPSKIETKQNEESEIKLKPKRKLNIKRGKSSAVLSKKSKNGKKSNDNKENKQLNDIGESHKKRKSPKQSPKISPKISPKQSQQLEIKKNKIPKKRHSASGYNIFIDDKNKDLKENKNNKRRKKVTFNDPKQNNINNKMPSKLKLRRAQSNEDSFRKLPKINNKSKSNKTSPINSPTNSPKKRATKQLNVKTSKILKKRHSAIGYNVFINNDNKNKKTINEQMNTLQLTPLQENPHSKRSKSGILLKQKKKNIKRGKSSANIAIQRKNSTTEKKHDRRYSGTLKKRKMSDQSKTEIKYKQKRKGSKADRNHDNDNDDKIILNAPRRKNRKRRNSTENNEKLEEETMDKKKKRNNNKKRSKSSVDKEDKNMNVMMDGDKNNKKQQENGKTVNVKNGKKRSNSSVDKEDKKSSTEKKHKINKNDKKYKKSGSIDDNKQSKTVKSHTKNGKNMSKTAIKNGNKTKNGKMKKKIVNK